MSSLPKPLPATLGTASLLALVVALAVPAVSPAVAAAPRISGPYAHENLAVYLIHGADTHTGRALVPLARALEQKLARISETSEVNRLLVENVSAEPVFIQAGEIVKGGKQDRVVGSDLILPPRSGKIAVPAHCVEQGRWSKRGAEAAEHFESAKAYASDRALKLANHKGEQARVWSNIAKIQGQLRDKLGAEIRARQSDSSLQLTLEHERVQRATDGYVKALEGLLAAHPDAIGYAFAISGRLSAAEVYGAHALFVELWPKLLRASAVEALSEATPGSTPVPPTIAAVQAFLAEAEHAAARPRAAGPGAHALTRETEQSLLVETRADQARAWLHKSYLKK